MGESALKLHSDLNAADLKRRLQVFNENFNTRRRRLTSLQQRLSTDLVRIATAHREVIGGHLLDWVRGEVEGYWASRRLGFRGWVTWGCDDAEPEGWSAPIWLWDILPEEQKFAITTSPPAVEQAARLPESSTEAILSWISGRVEMSLFEAESRVLDRAEIELASEPSPSPLGRELKPRAASADKSRRKADELAIPPVAVPRGATWEDLHITMNELLMHVEVKSEMTDRTFQEAGFEEKRRGKVPDRLWEVLQTFAKLAGVLPFHEPSLPQKTLINFKQYVSQLRKRLKALFPIEGDPFEPTRKTREYRSRFTISSVEGLRFPTPADATWDKVTIDELRSGRIRFSVSAPQRFGAYSDDDGEAATPEAAVREGRVERSYDLRILRLAIRASTPNMLDDALLAVLRGRGQVKRDFRDKAMLSLCKFLCDFMQITECPFQVFEQKGLWCAIFDASSATVPDRR